MSAQTALLGRTHTAPRQQVTRSSTKLSVCANGAPSLRMPCLSSRSFKAAKSSRQSKLICRAEQSATEGVSVEESRPLVKAQPMSEDAGSWVAVVAPEDLPKGQRKEVTVDGVAILLFWYRNDIFAIEARSPAEGAYSEGFIASKFTQDFCIECPATSSLFSLKTGEIVTWYPNNPVLRRLTPQFTCRNLQIYPVKLTQDAIMVDVAGSGIDNKSQGTRGGSDSSLEKNNVYGIEPKVYTETAASAASGAPVDVASVATNTVSVIGCIALGAAGTAVCNYLDTTVGLGIFWALYVGVVSTYLVGKLGKQA